MNIVYRQVLVEIIQFYTWCTVGENCPKCDAMEGETFQEGYEPSSHPNCDCYMAPGGEEYIYEEVADMEPGFFRIFMLTDMTGKKFISSEGIGPNLEKLQSTLPKPSSYSSPQLEYI